MEEQRRRIGLGWLGSRVAACRAAVTRP
uniref:Uncharacterized protein n=1 Tax=Arundo donax TaxID=35708 RepID=A0A0A9A0U0_ARUDO